MVVNLHMVVNLMKIFIFLFWSIYLSNIQWGLGHLSMSLCIPSSLSVCILFHNTAVWKGRGVYMSLGIYVFM